MFSCERLRALACSRAPARWLIRKKTVSHWRQRRIESYLLLQHLVFTYVTAIVSVFICCVVCFFLLSVSLSCAFGLFLSVSFSLWWPAPIEMRACVRIHKSQQWTTKAIVWAAFTAALTVFCCFFFFFSTNATRH